MTIPPSKLAAARLAAAEVFIAEGLAGTTLGDREDDAGRLRTLAEVAPFSVAYRLTDRALIFVDVKECDGDVAVVVVPQGLGRLSPDRAIEAADLLQRAAEIARKVEAAIAEALR